MITKDMNIMEILKVDENLAGILIASGMHCLGCAMAHFENLEQACAVHGIVGRARQRAERLSREQISNGYWGC